MRTNVEKVLERDSKLSELDDRADALQQGASQFEQQAGKLKRKFWLQNLKVSATMAITLSDRTSIFVFSAQMMIIMGVIGLVVVGIIASKLTDPGRTWCTHFWDTHTPEKLTLTHATPHHTTRLTTHTQNRRYFQDHPVTQLCLSFEFALI